MPVGCLGNLDHSTNGGGDHVSASNDSNDMDIIVTSSVLNAAEQFAFMQQTLLMQIFRNSPPANGGRISAQSESSSSNGSALSCPTCIAFADNCCQHDNGLEIFNEFVDINLQCYWDAKISEAVASLRYQGYVCPGILILIASTSNLETVADAWRRRLLISPPTAKISQLGLSNGCVVRPMLQTHTVALPDILCLILARLKQRGQTADMNSLCEAVDSDWSGAHRIEAGSIKEAVHAALGQLIKQRKVYYTGNKGYFLVTPDSNSPLRGLGNRFNRIRHSLRADKSGPIYGDTNKSPSKLIDQECQTGEESSVNNDAGQKSPSSNSTENRVSPSSVSPPNNDSNSSSSYTLERSQSLRISKKSLRGMAKGGSLRLSKKDAMIFREEDEDDAMVSSALESPSAVVSTPPSKTFERKNSFLGKLFNRKKSNSPSSSSCTNAKPEIVTFSAQFPPPELVEHYNSIYSQIRRQHHKPTDATNRNNNISKTTSPTAQVRNGPNGNFVVYERSGMPVYGVTTATTSLPPQPQQPPRVPQPTGIYSQHRPESVYSNPPPPLPYRPPPNPYNTANIAQLPPVMPENKQHSSPSRNASAIPTNKPPQSFQFTDTSIYGLSEPSSTSSSSGPSSIDSQAPLSQRNPPVIINQRPNLFDESLVVIEKSNEELESKLIRTPNKNRLARKVDTIHNNRNNLSHEVIYEVESTGGEDERGQQQLSRSSSQSTIKAASSSGTKSNTSSVVAPSFPSISDLTIHDVGNNFKSLTAQKLMAGLSFNSIDTLLEVNAVAEARNKMDESSETVDFGVI